MLVLALIAVLAVWTIVALSAVPKRAIVAVPVALLAAVLLIEEGGMAPRGGIVVALIVALLLASVRSGGRRRATPVRPAGEVAWTRLAGAAGLLTRGRVGALRRRYDVLLSRDAAIDPFSTFGELRIKLERRVPELIDNYLDEAATAPGLRRHALMTELLGDIEQLIARAEAVDPTALARQDRRTALKQHLKGEGEG